MSNGVIAANIIWKKAKQAADIAVAYGPHSLKVVNGELNDSHVQLNSSLNETPVISKYPKSPMSTFVPLNVKLKPHTTQRKLRIEIPAITAILTVSLRRSYRRHWTLCDDAGCVFGTQQPSLKEG